MYKLMKCGMLEPEDLTLNEFRLLKQYHPHVAQFVKTFLEIRHAMIQDGEWTDEHEPPSDGRRIKRYENGNSIVDPDDR